MENRRKGGGERERRGGGGESYLRGKETELSPEPKGSTRSPYSLKKALCKLMSSPALFLRSPGRKRKQLQLKLSQFWDTICGYDYDCG